MGKSRARDGHGWGACSAEAKRGALGSIEAAAGFKGLTRAGCRERRAGGESGRGQAGWAEGWVSDASVLLSFSIDVIAPCLAAPRAWSAR